MNARTVRPLATLVLLTLGPLCCDRQPSQPAATNPSSEPAPVGSTTATATERSAEPPPATSGPRTAAGVHYVEVLTAGAQAGEPLPLVVAIHGLGDRPERFAWLLRDLPVPARVVVPQGLDPWHGGFSWFPIRVWNPDPAEVARGVERAATALGAAIDELQARYRHPDRVVVTGFSQGGMLSFALAVHHSARIEAAFPIAGWLPPRLAPTEPPKPTAPPIVAFHGTDDQLLPIEPTRQLVRSMVDLGFDVELHELTHTGHTVSPALRAELLERIAKKLRARARPPRAPSAPSAPSANPAHPGAAR